MNKENLHRKNHELSKTKSDRQHSLLARKGHPKDQLHKMEQKPSMQKEGLPHICIVTHKSERWPEKDS